MSEVHGEVHIRYRCAATGRLTLLKRSRVDDALEIGYRETLVSGNIGGVGGNRLKAYIIQCKVITDIDGTVIHVNNAKRYIITRNRRFDDRRHTMPTAVFVIA